MNGEPVPTAVGHVFWNRRVPMRDGPALAADVVLPQGDGPWPAVLNHTPYSRGGEIQDLEWIHLLDSGYALVYADVRGRGDSEGEFLPFQKGLDDGYDLVEWIAAQPWCSGRVGMVGSSYEALTQWWAAASGPPHLSCIVPQAVGATAKGERLGCDTGVPFQFWLWWLHLVTGRTLQHPSAPSWDAVYDELPLRALDRKLGTGRRWWGPYLDGEWHFGSPDHVLSEGEWDGLEVPALVSCGWWDEQSTMATWARLMDSPAGARSHLLIGAWDHAGNDAQRPELGGEDVSAGTLDRLAYVERFFAAHLKPERERSDLPRCRVFRTGAMEWEDLDVWPAAAATPIAWHLGAGGALGPRPQSEEGVEAYRYDPADPVRVFLDLSRLGFSDPPLDNRYVVRRPDVLPFTSEPLAAPLDVSGLVALELKVSIDCPDTDVGGFLHDVHPDGRSIALGFWHPPPLLRLSSREGWEPRMLEPGEVVVVTVPIAWIHHTFLPGHRIRVVATSSAYPVAARNLNTAEPWADAEEARVVEVSVHHGGESGSRLLLPTEPAGR